MNIILGTNGPDVLFGGNGEDWLRGFRGTDSLSGGPGNDDLYGGPGADKLYGGAGQDILFGGPGRDVLEGGNGKDFFAFDLTWGNPGIDKITDFKPNEEIIVRVTQTTREDPLLVYHAHTGMVVLYQGREMTEVVKLKKGLDIDDSAFQIVA